jgi:hypothetical protein
VKEPQRCFEVSDGRIARRDDRNPPPAFGLKRGKQQSARLDRYTCDVAGSREEWPEKRSARHARAK